MTEPIASWIQDMMRTARVVYGVDPVIFVVIYLACAPVWWYSLARVLNAVARGRSDQILPWGSVLLVTTVAPFVYVMIFGRNLPWWVWMVIAVLVVQSLFMLYRKIKEGPKGIRR